MLSEIISNIPADPTYREVKKALDDALGTGSTEDLGELLVELLRANLGDFYDEAYRLLLKGVIKVNQRYEEDLFGC